MQGDAGATLLEATPLSRIFSACGIWLGARHFLAPEPIKAQVHMGWGMYWYRSDRSRVTEPSKGTAAPTSPFGSLQ